MLHCMLIHLSEVFRRFKENFSSPLKQSKLGLKASKAVTVKFSCGYKKLPLSKLSRLGLKASQALQAHECEAFMRLHLAAAKGFSNGFEQS